MGSPWNELKHAARHGRTEQVKQLLKAHDFAKSLDEIEDTKRTKRAKLDSYGQFHLLNGPVKNRHAEVVKLLLEYGFKLPQTVPQVENPLLHTAIKNQDVEIVKLLLKAGHNVAVTIYPQSTPLMESIKIQNSTIIKVLIEKGAVVDSRSIGVAVRAGQIKILELALDFGADACVAKLRESDALASAIRNKKMEVVSFLLNRGIDVNAGHETPLSLACQDEDITSHLLKHGARPDLGNSSDCALHKIFKTSCRNELPRASRRIIQKYLKYKININVRNKNQETALHLAVRNCCGEYWSTQVVKHLLERGIDVNAVNNDGDSALHVISWSTYITNYKQMVIDWLVDYGADINMKRKDGSTILGWTLGYVDVKSYALLRVIAKRKSENAEVSEDIISHIQNNRNPYCKSYYEKCLKEIKDMRSEIFNETHFSLYDLYVTKCSRRLLSFARNSAVTDFLKSAEFKLKYPTYAKSIQLKFKEYTMRQNMIDGSQLQSLFSRLSEASEKDLPILPFSCAEIVFGYLSNDDLLTLKQVKF